MTVQEKYMIITWWWPRGRNSKVTIYILQTLRWWFWTVPDLLCPRSATLLPEKRNCYDHHIHHPQPRLWEKTMAEFWTPSLLTLSSRWSVLILKSTPVGLQYWRLFDGEVVQIQLWGKLGGQNSFKFTYSGDVGVGKVVLRVSKQQWRLAHPRVSD